LILRIQPTWTKTFFTPFPKYLQPLDFASLYDLLNISIKPKQSDYADVFGFYHAYPVCPLDGEIKDEGLWMEARK